MQNISVISTNEIIYLPVDKIRPNPYQPRHIFEDRAMEELTKSIRTYGVMQPINVRFINNSSYELVSGERRLRASKLAGLATIPVVIVNINDRDSAAIGLIENMQRENLNYIEEAEALQALMEDFDYTKEEVAQILGKSQETVDNKLKMLELSKNIQSELMSRGLPESYAKALLRLDKEEKQLEVVKRVQRYGLNIRRTEELIENTIRNGKVSGVVEANRLKVKKKFKDIRLFTNTLKQAVDMMNESGMATDYVENKENGGYEIRIRVNM